MTHGTLMALLQDEAAEMLQEAEDDTEGLKTQVRAHC